MTVSPTDAPTGHLKKSAGIAQLAKALAAAQAELKNPPLDAVNPHFRNRYASLAAVRDAVTPVLAKHGLSVLQSAGSGQRGPVITTLLVHVSGEWVEGEPLEMPAQKQDAQGYGSAITYGRRYALQALLCVVGDDDDDARQAVAPATRQPRARPQAAADAVLPGPEFARKLHAHDAAKGYGGELVRAVSLEGKRMGAPDDLTLWDSEQVAVARDVTKRFEQGRRQTVKAG